MYTRQYNVSRREKYAGQMRRSPAELLYRLIAQRFWCQIRLRCHMYFRSGQGTVLGE